MPLYEYKCLKCGKKTEKIESVAGPHLKKCPHCGGKVERLQSAPAIQFKGSGWYVTDYAGKSGCQGKCSTVLPRAIRQLRTKGVVSERFQRKNRKRVPPKSRKRRSLQRRSDAGAMSEV